MENFIKLIDKELCVIERLWMTYDGYMREEYESAMTDQFYYLFFVDEYEDAIREMPNDELQQYFGLREFRLEFLND